MATGAACDFIKDLMPKVRVTKVTLLSDGGSNLPPDDPHIMHPDEGAIYEPVYAEDGSTVISYDMTSVVDSETSNGYMGRQAAIDAYNDGADAQTHYVIDFCIEETIVDGSDGMISSWFSNEDFTKYFKMRMVVLRGSVWKDLFPSAGKYGTNQSGYIQEEGEATRSTDESMAHKDTVFKMLNGMDYAGSGLSSETVDNMYSAKDVSSLAQFREWNVQEEIIALHGGTEYSLADLYDLGYVTSRSAGGSTFKIPFSTTLDDFDPTDSDCIYVYAWAALDDAAMEQDFKIDFDDSSDGQGIRSLDYQFVTVIHDNKVISDNAINRDSTTGAEKTNVTITDVRDMVSPIPAPDPRLPTISLDADGVVTPSLEHTYISDLMSSRKLVQHAPGNASVNYFNVNSLNMFWEKSRVGELAVAFMAKVVGDPLHYGLAITDTGGMDRSVENLNKLEEFIAENVFEIQQIKIERERVDTSQGHEDRRHRELVITVDQNSLQANRTSDDIQDPDYHSSELGQIHSMFTNVPISTSDSNAYSVNVKTYAFFDLDASRFSDGEYEYTVTFKIQDKMAILLSNLTSELEAVVANAKAFHTWTCLPGNYDWRTNKFASDTTARAMAANFETDLGGSTYHIGVFGRVGGVSVWENMARRVTFLTSLLDPLKVDSDTQRDTMITSIETAMNPDLGATPDSIYATIQRAENIIYAVRSLVGYAIDPTSTSYEPYSDTYDAKTSTETAKQQKDLLQVEYTFPTRIDANQVSTKGLDFLNSTPWSVYNAPSGHSTINDQFPHEIQTVSTYTANNGEPASEAVGITRTYTSHRTVTHAVADYYQGHKEYWNLNRAGNFLDVRETLKNEGVFDRLFAHMSNSDVKDAAGKVKTARNTRVIGDYTSEEGLHFCSSDTAMSYLSCKDGLGTNTYAVFDTSVDSLYDSSAEVDPYDPFREKSSEAIAAVAIDPDSPWIRTETEVMKTNGNMSMYMLEKGEYMTPIHGIFKHVSETTYLAEKRFVNGSGESLTGMDGNWPPEFSSYLDNHIPYPLKMQRGDGMGDVSTDPDAAADYGNAESVLLWKLKYGTLVAVQYLYSWHDDKVFYVKGQSNEGFTRPNVGNPDWRLLTDSVIESMASGQRFMCRLLPMDLSDLGVSYPKSLNLPIYNEYFILTTE